MNKLTTFICNCIIIIATTILFTGINAQGVYAQGFQGNSQLESENHRINSGESFPLDMRTIPEGAYHAGKLRIQFDRSFEEALENIDFEIIENDHIKTGILALDELNKVYKVHKYTPILEELYEVSQASLQYKERHRAWGFHLWYELKLDEGADIIKAFIDFEELDEVNIAEPVLKKDFEKPVESWTLEEKYSDRGWSPNDPMYANQWHFKNTGQVGGLIGMDCNAEPAWQLETGNVDVIVAILDSGMQFNHPDLEGNMWENIGPQGTSTVPGSHGTHVGGTVSAVTNNNLGVAGLAGGSGSDDGVRAMTIDRNSYGILAGFLYAADNGAAIIQNSWGYSQPGYFPASTKYAIDYFNEEGGGEALDGGFTVFSAGNDNANFERYPAYYEGTFAVASHDRHGQKSGFSNYGPWIDIIAPGTAVLSTEVTNVYSSKSGTSMSAPHVSGGAALVVSHAYGMLNRAELQAILYNSANPDIYQYNNPYYQEMLGSGRLDVYEAIKLLGFDYFTVDFDIKDKDGNEITDAVVIFGGKENNPGDYTFENVKEGTHQYIVEKEGFLTVEDEVYVDDDITIEVTMIQAYTVTFDVTDKNGNEITDAIITFDGIQYDPGYYVFEEVEEGTYDYKVEKEGFLTVEDQVKVEEDVTENVTMTQIYTVTFDITDENGNEITDAVITFDGVQYDPGHYVFEEVEEGTYDYKVEKEGFLTVEEEVYIDDDITIDVIMIQIYTVTFDITDENGNEITGAVITFDGVQYDPGHYVFEEVEEGTYDYKVEKEGFLTVEDELTVEEDVTENVTMIQVYTLTFDITDENGDEITGAVITFDGIQYDPGHYVFEDIEAGTYDYKVEKEGFFPVEDQVAVEENVTVNVVMSGAYIVTFEVTDNEGNELTDAVITFDAEQYPPGHYVFEEIEAGTYQYIVEKTDYVTIEGEIAVESDVTVEVVMDFDTYVDTPKDVELSVFHNPAREKFYVESNENIKQIRLIDISGQVILNIVADGLRHEINVSNLNAGIYFMQIHTANSVKTQRVQVTR